MDRSPQPQDEPRQAGRGEAKPRKTQQQQQKIPRRDLMGPAGDPAEGRRNVSLKRP